MPRCKNCKEKFKPRFSTLEKYCWNPDCKTIEAIDKLEKKKKSESKDWKKRKKKMKSDLKTRSEWMNDLQKVFNAYIRKRDEGKPCISCGTILGKIEYSDTILDFEKFGFTQKFDAGHFRSVGGNPELRFNEENVHGQCVHCNRYKHGALLEYRKGLIERIGENKVKFLERNDHEPLKLSVDEIKEMIKKYRKKLKCFDNQ